MTQQHSGEQYMYNIYPLQAYSNAKYICSNLCLNYEDFIKHCIKYSLSFHYTFRTKHDYAVLIYRIILILR